MQSMNGDAAAPEVVQRKDGSGAVISEAQM